MCPNPEFEYDPICKCWTACVRCGRLAWSHEQADPLQDLRNYLGQLRDGGPSVPPAMKAIDA